MAKLNPDGGITLRKKEYEFLVDMSNAAFEDAGGTKEIGYTSFRDVVNVLDAILECAEGCGDE